MACSPSRYRTEDACCHTRHGMREAGTVKLTHDFLSLLLVVHARLGAAAGLSKWISTWCLMSNYLLPSTLFRSMFSIPKVCLGLSQTGFSPRSHYIPPSKIKPFCWTTKSPWYQVSLLGEEVPSKASHSDPP